MTRRPVASEDGEDVELAVRRPPTTTTPPSRRGATQQQQHLTDEFMERTTEQLTALATTLARVDDTTTRTLTNTDRIDAQLSVQRQLLVDLMRNPRSDLTVWFVRLLMLALFLVLLARWLLV